MREHKLRVGVNARPKPEIAASLLLLRHAARVAADILPLLIHLDSRAGHVAQFFVHVIRERLASLANDAGNGIRPRLEHVGNGLDCGSFTERRQN